MFSRSQVLPDKLCTTHCRVSGDAQGSIVCANTSTQANLTFACSNGVTDQSTLSTVGF